MGVRPSRACRIALSPRRRLIGVDPACGQYGIVYLGELNVSAELVRNGYSWALRRYMREQTRS